MRCTPVSEGCAHCWHLRFAARHAANSTLPPEMRTARAGGLLWMNEKELRKPLSWRKPKMVAVQLMGDLFHESVHISYIADVFNIMASRTTTCGKNHKHIDECWTGDFHTFLILTKRVERMSKVLGGELQNFIADKRAGSVLDESGTWPLPNVWLGVTAENQARWDERVSVLKHISAAKRFISVEPLLDYIYPKLVTSLDWVICGAEQGPGARHMDQDWAIDLECKCRSFGVPFFFKKTSNGEAVHPALDVHEFPLGYMNEVKHGA